MSSITHGGEESKMSYIVAFSLNFISHFTEIKKNAEIDADKTGELFIYQNSTYSIQNSTIVGLKIYQKQNRLE